MYITLGKLLSKPVLLSTHPCAHTGRLPLDRWCKKPTSIGMPHQLASVVALSDSAAAVEMEMQVSYGVQVSYRVENHMGCKVS